MITLRLVVVCSLLVAGIGWSDDGMQVLPPSRSASVAGNDTGTAAKTYIVQLKSPAAADRFRRPAQRWSGKPGAGKRAPAAFDANDAAVLGHAQKLEDEQAAVLADMPVPVQRIYSYKYSLNGFAARMTPQQADRLRGDDRVQRVWEDEIRPLATRTSPQFLGLFDRDGGLRGELGLDGEGIIIGVIDSGVAPRHPSLKDTVEADRPSICKSSWAENTLLGRWLCRRYDVREDELVFDPPENWNGTCEAGDGFDEDDCNNKLIGARFFASGAQASLPIDPDELFSPADVFGHGTHVATIAAGNKTGASIFGTLLGNIQGVAPRARIAVYKACWIRVGESSSTCNTSDLANAIDQAVADGVHIINYSVGNSLLEQTAPDDLALIAAARAGVLTAVAAGNEGPNLATIGSPAGNAAVITVAASSRDGSFSQEAIQVDSPASVAGRYAVREASFTTPLTDVDPLDAELVLVDDGTTVLPDGSTGTLYDACESIENGTELDGNVALIQRGGCDFEVKVRNAGDAGAVAALVFNIAGDPIVMTGEAGSADIPALMIGQADGQLLFDELDAGNTVEVVLDKGLLKSTDENGNVMGAFSARGPGTVNDVLKPDVTAPGINILAGSTPLSIVSVPDENFAFISGTSMATPHVAGVAALLLQAHPEWSPAAIKSALVTTARQNVTQQDGTTPAHAFDFGAGHVVANAANDPGFVFEMTDDDYDAYSCAIGSTDVAQARCDELAANGVSLEVADVNQPSISVSRLANTRTVRRRVTSVSENAGSYSAQVVAPNGIDVQVTPSSLVLGPGQSADYEVTFTYVSGSIDLWRFGSLTWVGVDHSVRSPLAVRPTSIDAPAEVGAIGGSGSLAVPVTFGYNGAYLPAVHGLDREDRVENNFVDQDPQQVFSFRGNNGVTSILYVVNPNQLYVRFALRNELTDGDDDLDLYVYYSADYDVTTDSGTFVRVGESGNFDSDEEFSMLTPPAGVYAVLVHGFRTDSTDPGGPGAVFTLLAWELGLDDDVGNMSVDAPTIVNAGDSHDVNLSWSGLAPESYYLGAITHGTPNGVAGLTIVNIRN